MVIFHSYVSHFQRVYPIKILQNPIKIPVKSSYTTIFQNGILRKCHDYSVLACPLPGSPGEPPDGAGGYLLWAAWRSENAVGFSSHMQCIFAYIIIHTHNIYIYIYIMYDYVCMV